MSKLIGLVLRQDGTIVDQRKEIDELKATVERQAERIADLEEEVAKLRVSRSGGIAIKPGVKKKEKQPRKKRKRSFVRQSLPATRVVVHAIDECLECGRKLRGGHVKWHHRVVDIPPVKVDVVQHLFVERHCGVCSKRFTPDPVEMLSDEFGGALVTDFHAAYNFYLGPKQQCWVHLGRDLESLVEKNPDLPEVAVWVDAERMTNFISELFVFVADSRVPSKNNAAERAIHPAVVAGKTSSGTRQREDRRPAAY